ncbi:hypothetical protein VSS74_23380 [Conexibacter stalactiti]|uniref:Uncharacterized protein n=1 Tax=Conexibacter stalactiti TaxID=1940611 RepID=A0ABU4HVX2_9ACTN|nr:hypothetical protein [Conexibacter stalactiti]MDW5597309.1 hypothetical protein [Conexibacter stalactiti]MEC5037951.1 hypothetical protein [Conexibacter stalactiti]
MPAAVRIPTLDDYHAFDGAHCHRIWRRLSDTWRCPGCARTKFEILRWTRRRPPGSTESFMGWLAAFHGHHDHASDRFGLGPDGNFLAPAPGRFEEVIICDHCNSTDGIVKRKLGLPQSWSFSVEEIAEFITARPHAGHVIDYDKARIVYARARRAG